MIREVRGGEDISVRGAWRKAHKGQPIPALYDPCRNMVVQQGLVQV